MSLIKKAVVAAGLLMLGYLLWRLDPRRTAELALTVGWLFVPIFLQEVGAHGLNALGWRLAFRPENAASFSFWDLFRYRVMGDGVNYLTPSATIAGEFARASLLSDAEPLPVRVNGVVAAKFSQGIAQVAFICVGLGWCVRDSVPSLAGYAEAARATAWGLAAASAVFYLLARSRRAGRPSKTVPEGWKGWVSRLPSDLSSLAADHPLRCLGSIAAFTAGYAWNTGESWLIAHALGIRIDWTTALHIEVLSNMIDAVLFMVPAKAGTQEAGKTLIFSLLGLPPRAGLAFGLVRHARELTWAGLGLGAYAAHERSRKAAGAALPSAAPAPLAP
ncbi:MAG: flippase-like domain-containing protein [Elusimicrobia bacterium]|nr:flippase-like domain-containing protein [Elusimicrobiota bacterium]